MEIVELARWALDVAVVVEFLQPTKELLSAVAEQRRDVMGTQKAVTPEQAQNFRVTRSEFHRQKIFRPSKARMSRECHAFILPEDARSSKGVPVRVER